jgi:D-tyrosyl-tRNA(Tyr) deacylase
MRAVVQRVSSVCVRVAGREIARGGEGLLALVGVAREDSLEQAENLARRIAQLRIFEGAAGGPERSLIDVGGTLCVVSQFTLYGDARKGRRPAYLAAAPGEQAAPLIDQLVAAARTLGVTVVTGSFGADMDVELCNRGPFTILLDTENRI